MIAVFAFVVIGKDSHAAPGAEADLADVVVTSAPFLLALVVGWFVMRAWQRPAAWTTGFGVLAVTVALGMLLRNLVFNDGTAFSFVLVTAAFLGLGFLGWRAIAQLVMRRRSIGAGVQV